MQVTTYWLEHAWLGTHVEPGVSLDVAGGGGRRRARGGGGPPPPAPEGWRRTPARAGHNPTHTKKPPRRRPG
ncbi:hypothetical protein ACFWZR_18805, partial [Streptomyces sp. NPDC059017]